MRDYYSCAPCGTLFPIAKTPTVVLNNIVAIAATGQNMSGTVNPGVTKEQYLDRIDIELMARKLGLSSEGDSR